MENKREKVRMAIVAACPEIMALEFGCRVLTEQYRHLGTATILAKDEIAGDWKVIIGKDIFYQHERDFEIIGHPITLLDIKHCLVYYGYTIVEFIEIAQLWNTNQSLDLQSEDLINKMYGYLYHKNENG